MPPTLSKKLMRSLPTLTEVVMAPTPQASAPQASPGPSFEEEVLVQRVLQRLELTLDEQVRAVVSSALEEQMKELAPRIRQRVDNAVRKAVTQAVAGELRIPPGTR